MCDRTRIVNMYRQFIWQALKITCASAGDGPNMNLLDDSYLVHRLAIHKHP